ncbi:Beta-amyrin 28-monooxygenase [Holothuria leucospilota]|uniref:Beta-amyrin 28-monooxygenase n=1 Tax=Holothuria leucospilota TaxID=206669 RepID=A0A9Q0YPM5_HOLLE|nr:Beta-amyrin 28-monooxygenase [Holothuria leucospilota]
MAKLKGHMGWTLAGDRSLEFWQDPISFINRRIEQYSCRIFIARTMNKPTVFVCSWKGVHQLLREKHAQTELGYKILFHRVFGDNILFEGGEEGMRIARVVHKLFGPQVLPAVEPLVERIMDKHFTSLDKLPTVPVYTTFKTFATELSMALFMGLDPDENEASFKQISNLATAHWHGMITLPVKFTMPVLGPTTFNKAIDAQQKLLAVIREKLDACQEGSVLHHFKAAGFKDRKEVEQHVLLFSSAVIPKAFAAFFTSFTHAISGPSQAHLRKRAREDDDFLDCIQTEVERLWPPFLGGRRNILEDIVLDGYRIPKGHVCVYISRAAHRDPAAFLDPDSFKPERWLGKTRKERQHSVLMYGAGPRSCVGYDMVRRMITMVCKYMVQNYDWEFQSNEELEYKWLPVSRPKEGPPAIFTAREPVNS